MNAKAKRCPKCRKYTEPCNVQCPACNYVFKTKIKIPKKEIFVVYDWPCDEWKDWNTM